MKQSYRMGLIAISVASMFGSYTHAATEAEERAKRQLALLQQKLEALQQGVTEQDKALRDANRRNSELMHELNSARTVIRWIGNNPAAIKKIGAESAGDDPPPLLPMLAPGNRLLLSRQPMRWLPLLLSPRLSRNR